MEEKIIHLLEDESFAAALETSETSDDVLKLFNIKGVTLTVDDLKALYEKYGTGELSEDDLEDVAGGYIKRIPLDKWKKLFKWLII